MTRELVCFYMWLFSKNIMWAFERRRAGMDYNSILDTAYWNFDRVYNR